MFYERSHPLLLQAAYALWLSRRNPAAVAFAAPYAMNLRARARGAKSPVKAAAFHVAYDAVQIARDGPRRRPAPLPAALTLRRSLS